VGLKPYVPENARSKQKWSREEEDRKGSEREGTKAGKERRTVKEAREERIEVWRTTGEEESDSQHSACIALCSHQPQ
jgi:hypothetical protein